MEIQAQSLDLKQDLIDALLAYDIWREFTDERNRKDFETTMRRFPRYFEATIHASLVTVIVITYRLFEDRPDTVNFYQFLREVSSQHSLSLKVKNRVATLKREIEPAWKKVCILRNNVFSHRSKKLNPEEAFQKASITPNEIKELMKKMGVLLNVITKAVFFTSHTFNRGAKRDVINLMALIRKCRPSQRVKMGARF